MRCSAYYLVVGPSTEPDGSNVLMRLYTRWDGHPIDALVTLECACEAVAQAAADPATILTAALHGTPPLVAEFFAGQLIRYGTRQNGMTLRLDGDVKTCFFAPDDPNAFDRKCEWLYAVDLTKRSIRVFGSEETMASARDLVAGPVVDFTQPHAFSLLEDADAFDAEITQPLARIAAAGFRVQPPGPFVLLR